MEIKHRQSRVLGATAGLSSSAPRIETVEKKHCQTSWQWHPAFAEAQRNRDLDGHAWCEGST
jgi:hypothetical protein